MSDHDRKDIFRVSNYEHPFDDYEGQPVLVLDEFNSQLQFQLMLNILDRYPCKLPCRYRDAWAGWTEVWIVSNKSLPQQYEGVDEQIRPALDRRISEVLKMLGDGSTVSQDDIEKTEDDEWGFL